ESDYAVRLREKQRLRAQYGLNEKQLRRAFDDARKLSGQTGESLIELLESRLDALVLRSGFARTTAQARQAVTHRHILVDGKIVDRPSYRVKPGQVIQVKPKSQSMVPFEVAAAGGHREVLGEVPSYLDVQLESLRAELTSKPLRAQVPVTCEVNLVVEYYARYVSCLSLNKVSNRFWMASPRFGRGRHPFLAPKPDYCVLRTTVKHAGRTFALVKGENLLNFNRAGSIRFAPVHRHRLVARTKLIDRVRQENPAL